MITALNPDELRIKSDSAGKAIGENKIKIFKLEKEHEQEQDHEQEKDQEHVKVKDIGEKLFRANHY
jgi:hypothetical protein